MEGHFSTEGLTGMLQVLSKEGTALINILPGCLKTILWAYFQTQDPIDEGTSH